jgi:hypothetical protein
MAGAPFGWHSLPLADNLGQYLHATAKGRPQQGIVDSDQLPLAAVGPQEHDRPRNHTVGQRGGQGQVTGLVARSLGRWGAAQQYPHPINSP